MSTNDCDKSSATVIYCDNAHDGPGWYWVDDQYPDEGTCGAFETASAAEADARESFEVVHVVQPAAEPVEANRG